jgi:E3 ubiquitin-protein ligase UBR7
MTSTLALGDILSDQASLIREASLALPHSFSQCTYARGPIRQSIYLCLTCSPPSVATPTPTAICSACSIACHTHHNQLELFAKRDITCDCPTSSLPCHCTLHKTEEDPNRGNKYGPNFLGLFCRCKREYDARKEREDMIQCLVCEVSPSVIPYPYKPSYSTQDWFHESCLHLRERPPSRESTPEPQPMRNPDSDETSSTSSLPPPLLSADEYDTFICSSCVSSIPTLQRYAGTPGMLMVIRDDDSSPWKLLDTRDGDEDQEIDVGTKRTRPLSPAEQPMPKRVRSCESSEEQTGSSSNQPSSLPTQKPDGPSQTQCIAPPPNPFAISLLSNDTSHSKSAGDIFLTEGWREKWCRCSSVSHASCQKCEHTEQRTLHKCLPSLLAHPYLLKEEETYEPPEDPEAGTSLEELGLRALSALPRDRAIDGILAFNGMRFVIACLFPRILT